MVLLLQAKKPQHLMSNNTYTTNLPLIRAGDCSSIRATRILVTREGKNRRHKWYMSHAKQHLAPYVQSKILSSRLLQLLPTHRHTPWLQHDLPRLLHLCAPVTPVICYYCCCYLCTSGHHLRCTLSGRWGWTWGR